MHRISTDKEYLESGRVVIDADGIPVDVSDRRGTGSPEGVVAAPVGATYTDEAATAGAVRWIKTSGTGTSGWKVLYGDTGRRRVALPDPRAGGFVNFRRRDNTVEMYIDADLSSWSSGDTLLTVPDGFRLPFTQYMPPGYNNTPNVAMIGGNRMAVYTNSARKYIWKWSWLTEDPWPTLLPGSPA